MKALLSGAAVALGAGLLMGAALKPDLGMDDRPAGPQEVAWNGVRSTGPFDDGVALASYGGKLPDYVLGTDFKTATTIYPTAEAPAPIKVAVQDDPPPEPTLTPAQATYDDDPPPQPSYPSIDGGAPDAGDAAGASVRAEASEPQPDDPTV